MYLLFYMESFMIRLGKWGQSCIGKLFSLLFPKENNFVMSKMQNVEFKVIL